MTSEADALIGDFIKSMGLYNLAGRQQLVALVESVAEIPWGEGRTLEDVLKTKNVGTCTGKHLALESCLEQLGIRYRKVVCTFRWGEQGIKYPKHLKAILDEGGWEHGHNFVQIEVDGRFVDVDVTWNSKLKPYGFRTFPRDWTGKTPFVGVDRIVRRWEGEGLQDMKKELIDALNTDSRQRRERFLHGFIGWVKEINNR